MPEKTEIQSMDVTHGVHVDSVISNPMFVHPHGATSESEPEFGIVAVVNGVEIPLIMTVETANALSHAIEHGHLPRKPKTIMGTTGYQRLKGEWSTMDAGPYEDAIMCLDAVMEVLTHLTETLVPDDWGLHGSSCRDLPEKYPVNVFADLYVGDLITIKDLLTFGEVMSRYMNTLAMAGKLPPEHLPE